MADPIEDNSVYVSVSGYRWDEFQPHIFKSEDLGQNWMDISSNLPEAPVNDIIVNPANSDIIFVATDMGVFVTYNGGEQWEVLGDNLPNVVINDLVYHQPTNKLIAGTYGRSLYTYDLEQDPLTEIIEVEAQVNITVFPNPFREKTSIRINGDGFAKELNIYNLSGRLVTKLTLNNNESIYWDGTNTKGEKLSKGVYFCRTQSGSNIISQKIIIQ